jgi:hypothetical protein
VILGNLDRYNNQNAGYSLSNNFIFNSFNDPLGKKLSKIVYDFDDAVQKAKEKYGEQPIPFVEIANITGNVSTTELISKQISLFYDSELPYAQILDDTK